MCMLVVDLFEQVLDVALDPVIVHVREDRLNCFRLRELIELLAPVYARELQDKRESDCRIALHDVLDVVCLPNRKYHGE